MQYTLMFYMSPFEFSDPFWGAFMLYIQAVKDAGIFKGGAGLAPPDIATTVRLRDGKRPLHDSPYADTKEQLGGFMIIDVPELDAALDWAARYPAGPHGVVEVRPNVSTQAGQ
jgi:hypothetical protein